MMVERALEKGKSPTTCKGGMGGLAGQAAGQKLVSSGGAQGILLNEQLLVLVPFRVAIGGGHLKNPGEVAGLRVGVPALGDLTQAVAVALEGGEQQRFLGHR